MTLKKNMFLFYFSISLAIASSALYHFVAKSTPSHVNFTVSLLVTYAVAFVVTLIGFIFFPATNGVVAEIRQLNWASIGLAIAVVGIEFGFLLMYRAGWNLGIAAVLVGAGMALLASQGGRWAVLGILFVHMVLAIEGLLWRAARVSSDVLVWLLGAASAWVARKARCGP